MKQSFDHFIAEIQKIQGELKEVQSRNDTLMREQLLAKRRQEKLERQAKIVHTLHLGIFSGLSVDQIYNLACESAVYQIGWDTAFVVSFSNQKLNVLASFGANQKQMDSIQQLANSSVFKEAYSHNTTVSTFHSSEIDALALRAAGETDDLVAMPILFAEQLYGYLVLCTHTETEAVGKEHELDFLAEISSLIGSALQNSSTLLGLEEQNEKLRILDELKNSFISITSHQLRTPLSIVKWILSMLQSDNEVQKLEKQSKLINQAYESNERLIHVVNDLLNVSRIQNGKLPYNPKLMDMNVMLQDLINGAEKLIGGHKLTILKELPGNLPALELDPILFKEAVQNVINNAIDYSEEQGEVSIKAEVKGKNLQIHVSNTGIGIQASDRPKIFDQFYRSPEAVQVQPNGNGLGLYLAHAIVSEHNGTLSYVSTPGKLTTFTITLPLTN